MENILKFSPTTIDMILYSLLILGKGLGIIDFSIGYIVLIGFLSPLGISSIMGFLGTTIFSMSKK
jgi:hypothetical protein